MTRNGILYFTVFCAFTFVSIAGKRVLLRPIPVSEVRRMLEQARREDAVPEGRVISHGLAAVKGFALGFKKGVLGVAIVDGLAALSLSSSNSSTSSNTTSSSSSSSFDKPSFSYNGTSNELCFTSRSATSDIVASGEARDMTKIGTTPTGTMATTGTVSGSGTDTGAGVHTLSDTMTTTEEDPPTVSCIVLTKS